MIRELSRQEKLEYDRLTRSCPQLTLADFTEDRALKNLPHSGNPSAEEESKVPIRKLG